MKNLVIRTALNYSEALHSTCEHPQGVSLTVPDMSMSLKTLVERYTRSGDPVELSVYSGIYDGDVETPHFDRMTAQQKLEYARNIKKSVAEYRSDLAAKAKAAKKLEKNALEELEAKKTATATEAKAED